VVDLTELVSLPDCLSKGTRLIVRRVPLHPGVQHSLTRIEANRTWMATVMMAADLVRWFQLLCLDGHWSKARRKALCWSLFHAPGRLVRSARCHIVRILDGWPCADALIGAYAKTAALC